MIFHLKIMRGGHSSNEHGITGIKQIRIQAELRIIIYLFRYFDVTLIVLKIRILIHK